MSSGLASIPLSHAIGLVFLSGFAFAFVSFFKNFWALRKVPGSLALPIVGHLYLPGAPMVMKFLSSMRRKHGRIFSFWPGNAPMVVVCEPKVARQVLTDGSFVKGADYSTKFAVVFGQGLVTSNGDKHTKDRQCMAKFFQRGSVERYVGYMNQQTKQMMKEVILPADGKEIDLQEFFHLLALRVFGFFAAGHDYATDKDAKWINHAVSEGSNIVGEHIVLGIPMWRFLPSVRKLHKSVAGMHKHIEGLIQNRLKERAEGKEEPDDVLKTMIDSGMSRQEMYEHFTTLLSAGHDTTAFFACYMAFMLANHPDVQDKCRKEINEVVGDREEVDEEDIKKLPYTSAVMKETLRLYTVIPFVNRTSVKDVKLRDTDITIPKNTTCLVPLCIMNRDADVWENPNEFIPERFLDIPNNNSAKHGFLPFGYGSRTCIGMTLALVESSVIFCHLLRKVELTVLSDFKPKITAGISLTSKNGIKVGIKLLN